MAALIRTPLTKLLPFMSTPIVGGPMANAAGGALAAGVSSAGGLGFIGAGYYDAARLTSELDIASKALQGPDAGSGRLNVGVGFLAWRLTKVNDGQLPTSNGAADLRADSDILRLIDAALTPKPVAIWLSFGSVEEMVGWGRVLREREVALNGEGEGYKLFVGIGNEDEAKRAVEEYGADVIIAQGCEAGGHGLGSSPPLHALLPRVLALSPTLKAFNPSGLAPPVLGAGGLSGGRSLAALLTLGAHGGILGTRLLLTPEAAYNDAQKSVLLKAGPGDTKRTMAFDEARGTLGWPAGVDGRGVVNETLRAYEAQEGTPEQRRERYSAAEKLGDEARIVTWAGSGVGLMNVIKPAAEVVREVTQDAIEAIQGAQKLLA